MRRESVDKLDEIFRSRVTTSAIAERLASLSDSQGASDAADWMGERHFDEAGVIDSNDSRVLGFVCREDLKDGTVGNCLIPFEPSDLISDSTPLADLLARFRHHSRAFVVSGSGVTGIVTRADLQKLPVRIYLFGLISLLEMRLADTIGSLYRGDTWLEYLEEERVQAARSLLDLRLERNEELDLIDCLQLADKVKLVVRLREGRSVLGFTSRDAAEDLFQSIKALRDRLAHAQDLVEGTTWHELVDTVHAVNRILVQTED